LSQNLGLISSVLLFRYWFRRCGWGGYRVGELEKSGFSGAESLCVKYIRL